MHKDQLSKLKPVGRLRVYDYDPDLSSNPIPPHLRAIPRLPKTRADRYLMRFEQLLNMFFRSIMMLACLFLAGVIFSQVVMRYGFDAPFSGIEEASVLLAVWVYFLGMGYATREREHIHGGIVSLLVKDTNKVAFIRFIGSIICMIAACVFGYYAYQYGLKEFTKGRVSTSLRWPRGLWSASMIVGFAMMIGYFLLETISGYRGLGKKVKQQSQSSRQENRHQPQDKLESEEV